MHNKIWKLTLNPIIARSNTVHEYLEKSAQKTTTLVGLPYCLWLSFSINRVFNVTKLSQSAES